MDALTAELNRNELLRKQLEDSNECLDRMRRSPVYTNLDLLKEVEWTAHPYIGNIKGLYLTGRNPFPRGVYVGWIWNDKVLFTIAGTQITMQGRREGRATILSEFLNLIEQNNLKVTPADNLKSVLDEMNGNIELVSDFFNLY